MSTENSPVDGHNTFELETKSMALPKDAPINDRYLLKEPIGAGGMGEVWKALDMHLDRSVALKFLKPDLIESSKIFELLFRDEAEIAALLTGHPNIIWTLDRDLVRPDGKIPFFVMELATGPSLSRWIEITSHGIDPLTVYNMNLLISYDICQAIRFSHKKGVMHRDIKPPNIFISEFGFTKVGDFGISKFVGADTRPYTAREIQTHHYAAPEQWERGEPTTQTDIYQLGCTLYELFTQRLPFTDSNLTSLLNAHLYKPPQSLREINPIISEKISNAVLRSLKKKKDDRIQVRELQDSIAEELIGKYSSTLFVQSQNQEIQKRAEAITKFDLEVISRGDIEYKIPDFREALSEGIEFILAGISSFKIRKE